MTEKKAKKIDWKARLQNPKFMALVGIFVLGIVSKYAPGHETDVRNALEIIGYVAGAGAAVMNPQSDGFHD